MLEFTEDRMGVLLFLIFGHNGGCMFFQALILSAAMEFGLVSGGLYNYSMLTKWQDIGALYTSLETKAQYGVFYIGGEMDCYFVPLAWNNYDPFQMTFIFKAGLDFDTVSFNVERSCFHPMNTYGTIDQNELKPLYEGGTWKVYARVEYL